MSRARRPLLTRAEITRAFDRESGSRTPCILSPSELASIVGVSVKTIYIWIESCRLDGCIRRRGKHILIWRDRAIDILFNGPNWSEKACTK